MPKVLIAEDDLTIALLHEEILVGNGYEVCGIARTVTEAVDLVQCHKPELAVVDLQLAGGEPGTGIAAQLGCHNGLGVLYASGSLEEIVLTAADGEASLAKPYRSCDLLRSLEIVSDIVANGVALPPFPRGFRVL